MKTIRIKESEFKNIIENIILKEEEYEIKVKTVPTMEQYLAARDRDTEGEIRFLGKNFDTADRRGLYEAGWRDGVRWHARYIQGY